MSDDIRREDVIAAVLRTHYDWSHDSGDPLDTGLRQAIENAIRAIPPSPRAAAAQRLARAAQATGGDFAHLCDNPNWPVAESPCPCPWCEMDRALAEWQEAENT